MPVPVTKYTCAFKCRKKAVSAEKEMRRHEMTCWNNPENKTCKTCSNEIFERDDSEYGSLMYRGCKINLISDVLDEVQDILHNQNVKNLRPIFRCPYWNSVPDSNIGQFAHDLYQEIKGKEEGTKHYPFYNKPEPKTSYRQEDSLPF